MPDPNDVDDVEPDEPTTYAPLPPEPGHAQDDAAPFGLLARATTGDQVSPNTFRQALTVAQSEAASPSQDWTGWCQKFVRSTYGIPALFSSAWTQWLGADDEDKHPGGTPSDAPLGSALLFKGTGPFGHIMLAARPFGNGVPGAWSNDLVTWGRIDKVARTAPSTEWAQGYLGYLTAVNDFDLQLKAAKPPKPKHDKPYKALAKSIDYLEKALGRARREHDWQDARVLRDELRRMKRRYAELRHP